MKLKAAAEALKESEERYRHILRDSIDGIAISRQGKVAFVNDSYCEMFGYARNEIIGKSMLKVVAPEDRPLIKERARKRLMGAPVPSRYVFRGLKKDGAKIFIEVSSSRSFVYADKPVILAIFRDITDRKKTDESLLRERQQLLSIFDSINEVVYVADPQTYEVLYVNRFCRELLDRNPVGRKCHKEFQNLDKPCPFCTNDIIAKNTERPYQWEHHNRKLNRNYMVFDRLIPWPDGRNVRFEIAIDITGRKRIEEALQESERRYRKTIDSMSDAIHVVDKNLRVVLVNRAFQEWNRELGFNSQIEGKDVLEAFPFLPLQVRDEYRTVFANGEPLITEEALIIKERQIFTETRKIPVFEGDRIARVLTIVRDISERKQIEQVKNNLIRDVSHGLKSPLAMTEMALHICDEALACNDFAQIRKAKDIAARNIDKLRKDVNHMVDMFALDVRKRRESKEKIRAKASLKAVVLKNMQDLQYMLERKGLSLKIKLALNATKIAMDERDAQYLFNNLIDNAIKFTERGGITITSKAQGKWAEVRVQDTGCGIAPRDKTKVFERFWKSRPAVDGSGLGLAICKEIVDIYGGKIEIVSRGLGKGATVIVRVPRG